MLHHLYKPFPVEYREYLHRHCPSDRDLFGVLQKWVAILTFLPVLLILLANLCEFLLLSIRLNSLSSLQMYYTVNLFFIANFLNHLKEYLFLFTEKYTLDNLIICTNMI